MADASLKDQRGGKMIGSSFLGMVGLAFVMGFSIYLSFPLILKKNVSAKSAMLLVSLAVGILIFLIGDIFSDVASQIYPSGSYQANPILSVIFAAAVAGVFSLLYLIERPTSRPGSKDIFIPKKVALVVAIGMGLQNLTEGLVFGSAYVVGLSGLFLVILIGFILQNLTEGFPIVSPFLGRERPKLAALAGLYFIGGSPTIIGGIIGYFYVNTYLEVLFDGLAIGAILFVIIPMLRTVSKQADQAKGYSLVYTGLIFGFLAGFAVNAL